MTKQEKSTAEKRETIVVVYEEKQREFERAAKPLIRFLHRNYAPHVAVYVDCFRATLMEVVDAVGNEREKEKS